MGRPEQERNVPKKQWSREVDAEDETLDQHAGISLLLRPEEGGEDKKISYHTATIKASHPPKRMSMHEETSSQRLIIKDDSGLRWLELKSFQPKRRRETKPLPALRPQREKLFYVKFSESRCCIHITRRLKRCLQHVNVHVTEQLQCLSWINTQP